MDNKFVIVDSIKWFIRTTNNGRYPQPICLEHNIRLSGFDSDIDEYINVLKCEEGGEKLVLPRRLDKEKRFVIDKLDSIIFSKTKFINLDDIAIPISESKIPKTSDYFVTARLMESKVGLRLVVYAGKKGRDKKTQIFIEPDIRRLAFDQNNLHPTDVFAMVEATFEDGTKAKIESKKGGDKK